MNVEKLRTTIQTSEFAPPVTLRMHSTGIADLDGFLNGGYPQGRITTIETPDKQTWNKVVNSFAFRTTEVPYLWYHLEKPEITRLFAEEDTPRVIFVPDFTFEKDMEDLEESRIFGSLLPRLRSMCVRHNVALVGFLKKPVSRKVFRFAASVRMSVRKTDIGYETRILKSTVSAGGGSVLQHGD